MEQLINEQLPPNYSSFPDNIGTMLFLVVSILLLLSPCLEADDPFKLIAASSDGYKYRVRHLPDTFFRWE